MYEVQRASYQDAEARAKEPDDVRRPVTHLHHADPEVREASANDDPAREQVHTTPSNITAARRHVLVVLKLTPGIGHHLLLRLT
ncbi:MAG: hypothetical protein ABIZ91_18290 [Gemmatimonadaceae bacterium]